MPPLLTAAVIAAVLVGAFAQRLSGIGFSLITAPSLTLISGPQNGVALTNLLSIVVALAVFATSVRHADRFRMLVLVPAGLVGVLPGAIIFRLLPARPLQVAVGVCTGLGLAAVVAARRLRVTPRPATLVAAGAMSGFTSAVAGAGGPALTVYAVATRWPQDEFAASCQIGYAAQAAAALAAKGLPRFSLTWLGVAVAAVLCGLVAGTLARKRVSSIQARRGAIALAALATLVIVIDGIAS